MMPTQAAVRGHGSSGLFIQPFARAFFLHGTGGFQARARCREPGPAIGRIRLGTRETGLDHAAGARSPGSASSASAYVNAVRREPARAPAATQPGGGKPKAGSATARCASSCLSSPDWPAPLPLPGRHADPDETRPAHDDDPRHRARRVPDRMASSSNPRSMTGTLNRL
jgi:hypothetical protein